MSSASAAAASAADGPSRHTSGSVTATATTAASTANNSSNNFSLSSRPTCPSILIPFESQLYALPTQQMKITTNFHVSTAFVNIHAKWRNIANYKSDCLFVLPLNGTVTNCVIRINDRTLETAIIPAEEAKHIRDRQERLKRKDKNLPKDPNNHQPLQDDIELEEEILAQQMALSTQNNQQNQHAEDVKAPETANEQGKLPEMSFDDYIPNLFRLPLFGVNSTDIIEVMVDYIEPLSFVNSQYQFNMPLTFGSNLIPPEMTMKDVIHIKAILHQSVKAKKWSCPSHEMRVSKEENGRLELDMVAILPPSNTNATNAVDGVPQEISVGGSFDWDFHYSVSGEHITPTLYFQTKQDMKSADRHMLEKANSSEEEKHLHQITLQEEKLPELPSSNIQPLSSPSSVSTNSGYSRILPDQPEDSSSSAMNSNSNIVTTSNNESKSDDDEGTFVLFVTPPNAEISASNSSSSSSSSSSSLLTGNSYHRRLVFLLDRSGSMSGEPYQEACRALKTALKSLSPLDQFNIIAFDHRQDYFCSELIPVSADSIEAATAWIDSIQPERGGTDIFTPLEWSIQALEQGAAQMLSSLPFIILLTDGCVSNEREICRHVSSNARFTRILTFGIGSYCNWFFLKMLAQLGRGFSDVVVYREKIYSQMLQLLNMASVPLVTNVSVEIGGLSSIELYPFPIPDLFLGAPLTISGKYRGQFPKFIKLVGFKADGSKFEMVIHSENNPTVPVNRVFIKQRLDLLTARSWLEESKDIESEVIDLSCDESMPSAYTIMVAYEASPQIKKALSDYGDGKDDDDLKKKKKKWYRDPKKIAALAVGNALLIGAAAFSFGDVAGTMGNLPVVGGVLGASAGLGCCDCCGCGCSCADCLIC